MEFLKTAFLIMVANLVHLRTIRDRFELRQTTTTAYRSRSNEKSHEIPVSLRKSPGRAVRAFKRGRSLTEISPAIYTPGVNGGK